MTQNPKLIVGGGGTGGHIYAGVAILQEFKRQYPAGEVLFVGATGGLEGKLVPREGFPLQTLSLGSLKGVSLRQRLKTAIKIPLALIRSARILLQFRPIAVIGVGGYASGPIVLMARLLRPILHARTAILEQNAVSGLTNRVLAKFVDLVFAAFPGIESQFPGKRVVLSGNPIRGNFTRAEPRPTGGRPSVFVFGGSQGAMGINTLILESLPLLADLNIQWVHQTGERDFERTRMGYANAGVTDARVEKFIYGMQEAYANADLVVCRAGSSTLAELAAVERPSFLIPFPFAADNHQEKNARLFEKKGGARVYLQGKTTAVAFATDLRATLADRAALRTMGEALKPFHHPECVNLIVKTLLNG